MSQSNDLKELTIFLLIVLAIVLAFSFVLFGMAGIRVVLGLIFISAPFYFILNNFEFGYGEKFVFSALLGLTIFSSLTYILGLLVSFRIAIAVTFVIFIGTGVILTKYKSIRKAV